MHHLFVTTATPTPNLRGRVGDSWAKVWGNYFSCVPAVQGKLPCFDIRILTPGRQSVAKGGAFKSKVLTSSLPAGGNNHSRALKLKSRNHRPSLKVGEQWLQMTGA